MPEPKILQQLIEGRAKIADPQRWASSTSEATLPDRDCAVTAVGTASDAYHVLRRLAGCKDGFLSIWNDNHTHAEVLALYDRAIKEVS